MTRQAKVTYVVGSEERVINGLIGIINDLVEQIDDNSFAFDNFDNSNRCKHCRSLYPEHKGGCTITELKEKLANLEF